MGAGGILVSVLSGRQPGCWRIPFGVVRREAGRRFIAGADQATGLLRWGQDSLESFQFKAGCVSAHAACRFAEKTWCFVQVGPGGAVLP